MKAEQQQQQEAVETKRSPSYAWVLFKLFAACALISTGVVRLTASGSNNNNNEKAQPEDVVAATAIDGEEVSHRRLEETSTASFPYIKPLMDNLMERKKLFEESEVIKYWFEYTGPLQRYYYRFSRSRGKADYFEGRDDSGVVSARFIEDFGGTPEYRQALTSEESIRERLLENCIAMGSARRPNRSKGSIWDQFFGKSSTQGADRCRVLFTLNTVGAGRGTIMLWETTPPPIHAQGPFPFMAEQESAAPHLQRNLEEIDAMCATGLIAARVQLLVCEPIDSSWVDWMDSLLVNCGGKPWPMDRKPEDKAKLEDRPSPIQVVVASTPKDAGQCHDLKSGFMERRAQSLILSVPPEGQSAAANGKAKSSSLVSSDDHDMYVSIKWSTLVTNRAISAFLQASADLAAAANSPGLASKAVDPNLPASPFLIPSFVPVSYLSEENSKTAKWRMHGDFFHPATTDIDGDSFDVAWIPESLAAKNAVKTLCGNSSTSPRKLMQGNECGQWWIYFTELQMPVSPDVYANEHTPQLIQGGSNSVWMVTERQREELAESFKCHRKADTTSCPKPPQAVIPLGDMESFLINFTPNTMLGKKHVKGRRPGYTHQAEREKARKEVHDRDQFDGEDDMESALFDYTVYPAALFRKDATIKAARSRDRALSKSDEIGPITVKSSYYDITITKPRPPVLGWCQAAARNGLCSLYADYFRVSADDRCLEACGLKKDFTPVDAVPE